MTDVVKITDVTPDTIIYGTYAAAIAYVGAMFGDAYTAWRALGSGVNNVQGPGDDQKRTLVAATRFIDRQQWIDDFNTFALRDASPAFQNAIYELAVLIADDPTVIAAVDAGSNIKAVNAGGAGVEYFNPSSAKNGTASVLPPAIDQLIGQYLASSDPSVSSGVGYGSGSCEPNPPDFDRWGPY